MCGASLIGANLRGANLHEANFSGADVQGARFEGAIDIQSANFDGAKIQDSIIEDLQGNIITSSEQVAELFLNPKELVELLRTRLVFENDVNSLLKKGMLIEAQALTRRRLKEDPNNKDLLEGYIGVLLSFNDKGKAEIAWSTLSKHGLSNIEIYMQLALTYWKHGEVQKAIEVDEEGLAIAKRNDNLEAENEVKNSLAYFYADTDKEEYEGLARRYSEESYNAQPKNLSWMDTQGYVKITYGKSDKEVIEGMHLCMQAYIADGRFPDLFRKHLNKGVARITKLKRL